MSVKGPWERRVGNLLSHPLFAWKYKPTDSPLYGGQPRIDWVAADTAGRFWMVEVKQLAIGRKSINLLSDVSEGQRISLKKVADTLAGVALLVVGQGNTLYVFDWRWVQWYQEQADVSHPERLPLDQANVILPFTSKKAWMATNLLHQVMTFREAFRSQRIPPTPPTPTPSPKHIATAPSTLRLVDSTPTPQRKQRSARSFIG